MSDIDRLIDERPVSALQMRVVLLCSLVVFVDGYDLQALALAVPSLAAGWGLPASSFGMALAASLVGLGVGGAFFAPLGDRLGRRPMLIGGLVLIGLTSFGTMLATAPWHLMVWRFLTGIGLGVCQGNATALTSDYAPARRRAALMTLMGCNVALGALVAAFVAPWVIERWSWQGLFAVGGTGPLLLALLIGVAAPESIRLLAAQGRDPRRLAAVLQRLAPGVDPREIGARGDGRAAPEPPPGLVQQLLSLVRPPLRERTLMLWLVYSLNAFLLYLLISWLPVVLGSAGWAADDALRGIVLLQLGGIAGALLLSWVVDRGRIIGALTSAYALSALTALAFVVLPPSGTVWAVLLVLIGGCISGGTFALFAVCALFYPPQLRATGFGWLGAVARVGAVLGPLAGGWVLQLDVPASQILGLLAVPALVCALAAFGMRSVMLRLRLEHGAPARLGGTS